MPTMDVGQLSSTDTRRAVRDSRDWIAARYEAGQPLTLSAAAVSDLLATLTRAAQALA